VIRAQPKRRGVRSEYRRLINLILDICEKQNDGERDDSKARKY